LASFFWGLIGGIVAWAATMVLGQPIYRFINLRAEAAEVLARYERGNPGDPGRDARDVAWLIERKQAYRECGSKLVAFAVSNAVVARLLRHQVLRSGPYYPRAAGDALMTLGDLGPGSSDRSILSEQIISSLKLHFGPIGRPRQPQSP
jgi:hypothetical protein